MLLATQTFAFESSASARTLIPARKVSTLRDRQPGTGRPCRTAELLTQTRFWESMTMSKGRLQSRDLDDLAVLDPSAGEVQQLIVRAVGDPDVAVRRDTDAHQAEKFLFEREVALAGDRLAVEIHHEDLAVEAGGPDLVAGDRGSPADAVDAHAGKAGDRRRERRSVGGNLRRRRQCS